MLAAIKHRIPLLDWLPGYQRQHLGGDVAAGLTTAVMLIPQSMAYAMLAGLPPVVGLYASMVPLLLHAVLGSSRQLAVGPVAMVSLLVAASVGSLAEPGAPAFILYAAALALMVGVLQLAMGVARLGFLVNFLSHPVISGFTSAAAIIIGLSQLKHLLGLDIARSHHVHAIVSEAVARIGEVHPITLAIGVASIAALALLKRYSPLFPRALAVVVVSTLLVWLLDLSRAGVAVVGTVPAGLPGPSFPQVGAGVVLDLLPAAMVIALVGFMESISVSKAFARRHGYEVDANQELIGLGAANLGAGLFGAYPVTGGFSRTAVNAQAGARTPLAGIIAAGFVALALLLLTPLFYYLPKAVLAGIIMTAVAGLVDLSEVRRLWAVKRSDLTLLLITFAATLVLGIEQGIAVGVGSSLAWLVLRTTRPHVAVLGRLAGTTLYKNLEHYPDAETIPGVLILRVDAQLYFGNITFLKQTLARLEADASEPLRAIILDASSVNGIDSSAAAALRDLAAAYRERGVALRLASVKQPVMDVLRRSGLLQDTFGEGAVFLTVHEAAVASRHDPSPAAAPSERARAALKGAPTPVSAV